MSRIADTKLSREESGKGSPCMYWHGVGYMYTVYCILFANPPHFFRLLCVVGGRKSSFDLVLERDSGSYDPGVRLGYLSSCVIGCSGGVCVSIDVQAVG